MASSCRFIFAGVVVLTLFQGIVCDINCITCRSYANQVCGLQNGNYSGMSLSKTCDKGVNQCFTYVTATPGNLPYIIRGCGAFPCDRLPGSNAQGDVCDENNYVRGRDVLDTGDSFNFTRVFTTGQHSTTAVLQYCRKIVYADCNSGLISDYTIPGYAVLYNTATLSKLAISLVLMLPLFAVFASCHV